MIAPVGTVPRRRSLCGECLLDNVCAKAKVTVPSIATIRSPLTRLAYQNYLVRLRMPRGRLVDYHVEALRDFLGRFEDEGAKLVQARASHRFLRPARNSGFAIRSRMERG